MRQVIYMAPRRGMTDSISHRMQRLIRRMAAMSNGRFIRLEECAVGLAPASRWNCDRYQSTTTYWLVNHVVLTDGHPSIFGFVAQR